MNEKFHFLFVLFRGFIGRVGIQEVLTKEL